MFRSSVPRGGGGGGGYGGCSLGGPGIEGVFHEWGHGMLCAGLLDLWRCRNGGGFATDHGQPGEHHKTTHQIDKPWKGFFHGGYPGGGGYEILADDPNWGYAITAITSTLAAQEDTTPMHVYAHLGEERGLWSKEERHPRRGRLDGANRRPIRRVRLPAGISIPRLRRRSSNRSFLVPVDVEKRIYRCPTAEAPDPFGVSISRLVPDDGAKKITVDFQGDLRSGHLLRLAGVHRRGRQERPLSLLAALEQGQDVDGHQAGRQTLVADRHRHPQSAHARTPNATHFLYEGAFVYTISLPGHTQRGDTRIGVRVRGRQQQHGPRIPRTRRQAYLPVEGKPYHSLDMIPTLSAAERKH